MATEQNKDTALVPAPITQVRSLPLPANLYGPNITSEVEKATEALRLVPQVENEDDKLKLEAAIMQANKVTKIAGEKRLDVTRVFDGAKTLYMQTEKDLLAGLSPELTQALGRVQAYNRAQLAKQREAERIAQENAQKELNRKRSVESKANVETKTQETLSNIAQEHKTAGVSTVWKGDVTNAALVPREYCVVDPKLIDAAIKRGVRNIPGVNIFEDVKRTGKAV